MGSGQYKRIYNIVFILLVICTCVFVYGTSKEFVSSIIENAKEDYQQKLNQTPPFDHARHDDLVNPFIRKCVNKGQTVLFAKNLCCTALAFG